MKKEASLVIIENMATQELLMVRNHRGINEGCVNFPSGKKEPDETMEQCAAREVKEETGLDLADMKRAGYVEFPTFDFYVTIFYASSYRGTLKQNDAEADVFWVSKKEIPYHQMRAADRDFIPQVLAGRFVKKQYIYDRDFRLIKTNDLPI